MSLETFKADTYDAEKNVSKSLRACSPKARAQRSIFMHAILSQKSL